MSRRASTVTTVAADLHVELSPADGDAVHARLTGGGNDLVLDVDRPESFAGSRDAGMIRTVAEGLAGRGIQVRVVHAGLHLVTIGDVKAPWWQRRATGSSYIRVGSWRGAWTSLRSRVGDTPPVLPGTRSLPPPTMLPLLPTLLGRRRVTATNSPGTGSPHLVLSMEHLWEGETQPVFWLEGREWTIGSGAGCDIVLPGLAELHARVVRDEADELMVMPHRGSVVRLHGAVVHDRQVLRTGSRIDIGEHVLTFSRAEYADHGRPYGGRVGGEAGEQRTQPRR